MQLLGVIVLYCIYNVWKYNLQGWCMYV